MIRNCPQVREIACKFFMTLRKEFIEDTVLVCWGCHDEAPPLSTRAKAIEVCSYSNRGSKSEIKVPARLIPAGGFEGRSVPCLSPSFCGGRHSLVFLLSSLCPTVHVMFSLHEMSCLQDVSRWIRAHPTPDCRHLNMTTSTEIPVPNKVIFTGIRTWTDIFGAHNSTHNRHLT